MPMPISGTVINTRFTKIPQGPTTFIGMGGQGEALQSEIHGKYWKANVDGSFFWAGTAAAGTTIPISSATASTFGIFNPINSGINVELVAYDSSVQSATTVVSSVLLGVGLNLNINPTGVTKATAVGGVGANGGAIAVPYTVATVVATTLFFQLGAYGAVTETGLGLIHYDFDGKIVLPPGSMAHVVGTAAQANPSMQVISWIEVPLPA